MIVVAMAVIKFRPPIADGTKGCTEGGKEKSKLADVCDMMMILSIFRDDARCRRVLEGVLRVFRAPQKISFICG